MRSAQPPKITRAAASCLDEVCGTYKVDCEDKVKEFFEAVGGEYIGPTPEYKLIARGDGCFAEIISAENNAIIRPFTPGKEFDFMDYKATIKFDCGTLSEERCSKGKNIKITRKFEGDKVCSEFCADGVKVCGKSTMKKC